MNELLTARQVAGLLQVQRETVSRWLAAGRLPAPLNLAGGRYLRWRREDIEAWVRAGCPSRKDWEALQAGKR